MERAFCLREIWRETMADLADKQSDFVLAVLTEGLRVREALEKGEAVSFEIEQAKLREMLLAAAEIDSSMRVSIPPSAMPQALWKPDTQSTGAWTGDYLGIRYPLACWLDELFSLDTPWADRWNERKLEVEFYATNDRAWKFWQQAAIVDAKADIKKLEVYFWCVMLGFKGMLGDDPGKLAEWSNLQREKLSRIQPLEFPEEFEPDPPTQVAPHHNLLRHRRMLVICGAILTLVIPTLFFLIVHKLAG